MSCLFTCNNLSFFASELDDAVHGGIIIVSVSEIMRLAHGPELLFLLDHGADTVY